MKNTQNPQLRIRRLERQARLVGIRQEDARDRGDWDEVDDLEEVLGEIESEISIARVQINPYLAEEIEREAELAFS